MSTVMEDPYIVVRIIGRPPVLDSPDTMNAHAILVGVADRLGLLSALSKVLADHQANITYVDIHASGAASDIYFEFAKPEGGIDALLAELARGARRAAGPRDAVVRQDLRQAHRGDRRRRAGRSGGHRRDLGSRPPQHPRRAHLGGHHSPRRRAGAGGRRARHGAAAPRQDAGAGRLADGRRHHRRRPRGAGGRACASSR